MTWTKYIEFLSSFAWRLNINLNEIGPVNSEKRFENVDDGQTDDGGYHPISSLRGVENLSASMLIRLITQNIFYGKRLKNFSYPTLLSLHPPYPPYLGSLTYLFQYHYVSSLTLCYNHTRAQSPALCSNEHQYGIVLTGSN